jgi:hypothetical protein
MPFAKVFCFFFSKKKFFPCFAAPFADELDHDAALPRVSALRRLIIAPHYSAVPGCLRKP